MLQVLLEEEVECYSLGITASGTLPYWKITVMWPSVAEPKLFDNFMTLLTAVHGGMFGFD